jgi:hypothetical protein
MEIYVSKEKKKSRIDDGCLIFLSSPLHFTVGEHYVLSLPGVRISPHKVIDLLNEIGMTGSNQYILRKAVESDCTFLFQHNLCPISSALDNIVITSRSSPMSVGAQQYQTQI